MIGVVSDSHDDLQSTRRAADYMRRAGVEAVIHLGDFIAPFTLRELARGVGVPIEGVLGNNDGEIELMLQAAREYNARVESWPRIVQMGGRRLLLMHGRGSADLTVEVAHALAESGRFEGVLYGHTHKEELTYVRGVLILNPGPLSSAIGGPSLALLDTTSMAARIVRP
ncbi:MAG: metallophosphoesterase [Acidilobus sp.]